MTVAVFTVADMLAVVSAYPNLPRSDLALAMTMLREGELDSDLPPWQLRYEMLVNGGPDYQSAHGGDDYDEMERLLLLAEEWHPDPPPPLLFDGEPADLSRFDQPRPKRVSCGGWEFARPTVRMLIDCESRDPTGGIVYAYHAILAATGADRAAVLQMPQAIFAQLEEGLAFLARGLLMRIIGLSLPRSAPA